MSDTFEIDPEIKMQAAAEIAAHPERKALAGLYAATALSILVLTVLAVVYVGWVMAR